MMGKRAGGRSWERRREEREEGDGGVAAKR